MLVRPQRFGDRQRLLDAPRAVVRRPLAPADIHGV
jgi:hypothetical protein